METFQGYYGRLGMETCKSKKYLSQRARSSQRVLIFFSVFSVRSVRKSCFYTTPCLSYHSLHSILHRKPKVSTIYSLAESFITPIMLLYPKMTVAAAKPPMRAPETPGEQASAPVINTFSIGVFTPIQSFV